ncbi:MAG: tRNA (adenosine(37)-N6)-threonylcarbamoyltransferase complex dimerization subunit type 1 TsaB, partial [Oscillospiraceae bacterium]|nr:tRNA (adenosine(37)-N6)-threonylcarbamoyltransferase complex dimerization subunit type 1 TsaB [Oscillospiraceae bacterium]
MKILALESSAKAASAAVMQDGRLAACYFQNCGLTHSVTLLKMADDMLKNLGMTMGDIDAVAVAIGPGSFTGIRIGVAAAKGLAFGADKPIIGVSTLEAMAYQC